MTRGRKAHSHCWFLLSSTPIRSVFLDSMSSLILWIKALLRGGRCPPASEISLHSINLRILGECFLEPWKLDLKKEVFSKEKALGYRNQRGFTSSEGEI
ncbi:hypothetical protein STEG23_013946 [Scotinomys teguina]